MRTFYLVEAASLDGTPLGIAEAVQVWSGSPEERTLQRSQRRHRRVCGWVYGLVATDPFGGLAYDKRRCSCDVCRKG